VPTTRILLVDNHAGARDLLVSVLEHEHFEVCGQAENGRQAISKVVELRPDVVVLDLLMPEMSGLEAAPFIRKLAPATKIVLISGCLPPQFGSEAARLTGAEAYVEKWAAVRDLVPTIRAVLGNAASGL
jgi:two-component system, chemotaxis family, chemotaxis protein CheY